MAKKKKNKKKGFSVFKMLIVILCFFSIIISVGLNVLFTRNSVPKIYDRYIYLVEDPNPLVGEITSNAALIAKDAESISIMAGDIVVCYPADNPNQLALRSINSVVESENGIYRYYTRDSIHEDNTDSIAKESILAVCTGYPESAELGMFINFTLSLNGIIAELVFPCVILILMLVIKIVSSKEDDDDEDVDFYSYDGDSKKNQKKKVSHEKTSDPLYRPDVQPAENDMLEKKKMSIAENFSQKKVDTDSPYQKEKERTMQFKVQTAKLLAQQKYGGVSHEADTKDNPQIEKQTAKRAELEKFDAPKPTDKTAEAPKVQEAPKPVEPEKTEPVPVPVAEPVAPASHEKVVPDDTGVIYKADVEKLTGIEEQKPVNVRTEVPASEPAEKPAKAEEKIDISETAAKIKKKKVAAMTVDELINLISEEQKKL